MEPTHGKVSWGRPAWSFFHGMTLDPLASDSAKRAQKRLMEILCYILPCPTCRKSYRKFSRSLPLTNPEHVGDWLVEIHDCVNLKLEKPAASVPDPIEHWKNFQVAKFANIPEVSDGHEKQVGYASYVEDMFFFLFTLAANYPLTWTQDTQVADKYREFFQTLPKAMMHRPWGRKMADYTSQRPLTNEILSSGREALMKWLYGIYLQVPIQGEQIEKPSFEVISKTMEMMRKK